MSNNNKDHRVTKDIVNKIRINESKKEKEKYEF